MIQRLAVFSDSHGDTASLLRAAEIQREYCQMMVFCGDGLRDWEVLTGLYPQMETAAVAGNCDFASLLPPLRLVEFAGCRVLILHGHTHHVKSGLDPLRAAAREHQAQLVLFGHTHQSLRLYEDGIWYLNPGSLGIPRDGKKTYGFVDFPGGKPQPAVAPLPGWG